MSCRASHGEPPKRTFDGGNNYQPEDRGRGIRRVILNQTVERSVTVTLGTRTAQVAATMVSHHPINGISVRTTVSGRHNIAIVGQKTLTLDEQTLKRCKLPSVVEKAIGLVAPKRTARAAARSG